MNDTNKYSGTGRLGVEPKIITTEGGTKIGKLFALLNESYVDKAGTKHESTLPVNLVLFKPADVKMAETELHTGSAIAFNGKLTHRAYDDEHGKKHSVYEVAIAGPGSKLEAVTPKANAAEAIGERQKQASAPAHNQ